MPTLLNDDTLNPSVGVQTPSVNQSLPSVQPPTQPSGNSFGIEEYDFAFKNEGDFSDEELSFMRNEIQNHNFTEDDYKYAQENMNLDNSFMMKVRSGLTPSKDDDIMIELTSDPMSVEKYMTPLKREIFNHNRLTKGELHKDSLKHVNALHYSKALNKPIDEVYADYDNIRQAYHGVGFGVLIDDETAFNQIREIYHPGTAEGGDAVGVAYARMKANWNRATEREDFNLELAEQIVLGNDVSDYIDKRNKMLHRPMIDVSGDNAFSGSFYEAVTMGSGITGSWIAGSKGALVGGAAGAALGAVTGPGAIATGLAGASKGFTAANYAYWTAQGTSEMMLDMMESGIPQDLARKIAIPMGLVYAGIEKIGTLDRLPGLKGSKAVGVRGAKEFLKKKLIDYTVGVIKESGEEGLQEGIEKLAQRIGYELSPEDLKKDIKDIPTLETSLKDMVKTTVDSIPSIMWLGGGQALTERIETRPETQAEKDKRNAEHKAAVKQQMKAIEDDMANDIKVVGEDRKEVEDDTLQLKKMMHAWLGKFKDEDQDTFERELGVLVSNIGLSDVNDMTRAELFQELDIPSKATVLTGTLKKMVAENRKKLIIPAESKAKLTAYMARTLDPVDIVSQEEAEQAVEEQLTIIEEKVDRDEELTDADAELLAIVEDEKFKDGTYSNNLVNRITEWSQNNVINEITDTPEQAVEMKQRVEKDSMMRKFVDYMADVTGRNIVSTGIDGTFADLVRGEIFTEEQAIQAVVDAGLVEEGEVDASILENVVVKGYNDGTTSYITKTGDITTPIEEAAEEYYKQAVLKHPPFSQMVKNNRRAYEKETGVVTTQSDVEWFSDRVVDYALNDTPFWQEADKEIKGIMQALKALSELIIQRALTTMDMIGKGTLSKSFEKSLQEARMPFVEQAKDDEITFQLEVKEKIKDPTAEEINSENYTSNEKKLLKDADKPPKGKRYTSKENAMARSRLKRVNNLNAALIKHREDILAKSRELEAYSRKWLGAEKTNELVSSLRKLRESKLHAITKTPETIFEEAKNKIQDAINRKETQELKDIYRKLLKTAPKARGKRPKGKTDADIQAEIDKVREVSEMSTKELNQAIEDALKLAGFDPKKGVSREDAEAIADANLARYNTFGNIANMDAAALTVAISDLRALINEGKQKYLVAQKKKTTRINELKDSFKMDITDGKGLLSQTAMINYMANSDDRKKQVASKVLLNLQNITTMSDLLSNKRTDNMLEGAITKYLSTKMQEMDNTYNKNLNEQYKEIQSIYKQWFGDDQNTLDYMEEIREDTGIFIKDEELSLSYADAITIDMWYVNAKGKAALQNATFTSENFSQLHEFMDKAELKSKRSLHKYSESMLGFYNNYYDRVNEVYRKVYNVNLPKEEFYSPLKIFTQSDVDNIKLLKEGGSRASLLTTAMMSRTNHKLEAKLSGISAFNILTHHVTSMENFIAKAEGMQEIRAVMQSKEIKQAITQEVGNEVNIALADSFDRYEVGPLSSTYKINTLDKLLSNYTKSKIALKVGNVTKQASSAIAYAINMPVADFVKGMTNFVSNPHLMQDRISELMQSQFMKERYSKGIDTAMRTALETQTEKKELLKPGFEEQLSNYMMIFTKFGDAAAIVSGGWALYDYKTRQYISEGMGEKEAKAKALTDFENATALMQQSGKSKDIGAWQESGNSLVRLFTMFQNSQFAYWRMVQMGYRNLRKGRGSKTQNLKALAIAGVILPASFASMSFANKASWALMTGNIDDPDEEKSMRRAMLGILTSPLAGIPLPIVGDAAESVANAFAGNYAPWVGKLPLLGDVYRVGKFTSSVFDGEFLKSMEEAKSVIGSVIGMPFDEMWKLMMELGQASNIIEKD